MPNRPVIANNTPLAALSPLGRLDLLRDLFDELLIPAAVHDEFLATEHDQRQAQLQDAPWLKVAEVINPRHAMFNTGLDRGESEVLALAAERQARLVIMDDRRGRRFARRLGFRVTGTVGLLVLAKKEGLLESVEPPLLELQENGFYLGPSLIADVLSAAGENPS